MLFTVPELRRDDERVLDLIRELHQSLRHAVAERRRWVGILRRVAFARAIRGSNSIEGFDVSLDDAFAAVGGEDDAPLGADQAAWEAVIGYRNAMTYVLQLAADEDWDYDESLLRSLHFMMQSYDLSKRPGRWRKGEIFVYSLDTQQTVYTGPDPDDVPGLMGELVDYLREDKGAETLSTAAMAHLNLTMIHPFKDGNGRMARCVQSLVLVAGDVAAAPEFCSIEEYLGANQQAYYEVLSHVGKGSYHPENEARLWLEFCLTAQFRQAKTVLRRARSAERFWEVAERELANSGLPDRCLEPFYHCLSGFRLDNQTYRSMANVSEQVASRDLKALVEANKLEARGEKRGRSYLPSERLRKAHAEIRASLRDQVRVNEDPYETVRAK
jgi:Fic family protein